MITARGMQGVTSGVITRRAAQPQPKQPAQIVTVRRKISTQPRDLFATVTLEAFDEVAGVVVRSESFRVAQPLMNSTIISRKLEFCDALMADGYAANRDAYISAVELSAQKVIN